MGTAVENPPHTERSAGPTLGLLPASLVGAVLLAVAVTVVGTGVGRLLSEVLPADGMLSGLLRYGLPVAAILAAVVLVFRILRTNGPAGSRGGAFLIFSCLAITAILGRAVGTWMEGNGFAGQLITGLVLAGLLFGTYKLITGGRGVRWMHAIESQGWFSAFAYKRTQGQRVRKWTMIGLLLVGGTGVYAIVNQGMLPVGNWAPRIPFLDVRVPILPVVHVTLPILLTLLTLWLSWRAVNVPPFADFLIATEAEMNKVSWTPWRKLVRDTVVVLVFTALLTAFLLTVDLFWGWTLSHRWVGVLPAKDSHAPKQSDGAPKEW